MIHKHERKPPRALIFDYGQVLSLPQNRERRRRMIELSGLEEERFLAGYRRHRLDYDRGVLPGERYWARVLGLADGAAGGGFPDSGRLRELLEEDALSWMDLNGPVLRWALGLAEQGLPIAILSNMPREILTAMRASPRFDWLERFTVRVFSCELGLVKPEPEIYRYCLAELGLGPGEVVFLDDDEGNVAGARRVGIETEHFRPGETRVEELAARLGLEAHLGL